jgi:hypothetical protein
MANEPTFKELTKAAGDKTIFKDKENANSMARVIAFLGAVGGLVAMAGGLAIVIMSAATGTDNATDIAKVGRDIVLAGLGVFTAGGLTKVGSGITEAMKKRG